jgi:hypothetical protein
MLLGSMDQRMNLSHCGRALLFTYLLLSIVLDEYDNIDEEKGPSFKPGMKYAFSAKFLSA